MLDHPGQFVRSVTSARQLIKAYRKGDMSPVEVVQSSIQRVRDCDQILGAMVLTLDDLARTQAKKAESSWRDGSAAPLAGVPVTIKDTFDIAGYVTTYGSRVHRKNIAFEDSGLVRRLRAAGAVFIGKTNTAEFGQSATSENRLEPVTRNPWKLSATPGGSSGGAAVSVAAGYVPLALGADGGGSIRIPAAMTGVFGFKPSYGLCVDEGGFRAMSDFACAGPLSQSVADARLFLTVLAGQDFMRSAQSPRRRIAYCTAPDGLPVQPAIRRATERAAVLLSELGHHVEEVQLDLSGWEGTFGPLVLAEEWRERGHLAQYCSDELTDYALSSLRAAGKLTPEQVAQARRQHVTYRTRIDALFDLFDMLLIPTTASPAFAIGDRPEEIDGKRVNRLWGPFPFTSPFNVAGIPAAALPCGVAGGLPVSVQLVAANRRDEDLLNLAEDLEEALDFRDEAAACLDRPEVRCD